MYCNSVWSGTCAVTFLKKILRPSSGKIWEQCGLSNVREFTLEGWAVWAKETLVSTYQCTWCRTLPECNITLTTMKSSNPHVHGPLALWCVGVETTDRWKYPLLFCSLLRMQFWRSHVWRATFPLGIPHSFKWTHCSRLSQLFYCYINVNLKILDLLSMCYVFPLFNCIYKVSYVSLVKVELKFSYARLEEVRG